MIKKPHSHITMLAITLLLFLSVSASKCTNSANNNQANITDKATAKNNYERLCASCHGLHMERFSNQDRQAFFNTPFADMVSVIKDGDIESGMPAFGSALSDVEISDLTAYILTDIKAQSEQHEYRPKLDNMQESEKINFILDTLITGLDIPWGLLWLPDGDMIVAERNGRLLRYRNDKFIANIEGLPQIYVHGQGGLLDIKLHPHYPENGWLYLSYSTLGDGGASQGGNTAIMRAKLDGNKLVNKEVLFKAIPDTRNGVHFGCRMVFDDKGYLYFAIGDRGQMQNAQDLSNDAGKIHRIYDDGLIPADNPFFNEPNAQKTIWSYGHRNPQGLVIDRKTGVIWSHEHGPKGGDELNIIKKGANYGWPVISYGINYNGTIITEITEKEGMEQPVLEWTPSIAPCGMTIVSGSIFKAWENNFLTGSLSFRYLVRNEITDNKVTHQEILLREIGRVRNVETGPDGFVYVAVENPGIIYRLIPID